MPPTSLNDRDMMREDDDGPKYSMDSFGTNNRTIVVASNTRDRN